MNHRDDEPQGRTGARGGAADYRQKKKPPVKMLFARGDRVRRKRPFSDAFVDASEKTIQVKRGDAIVLEDNHAIITDTGPLRGKPVPLGYKLDETITVETVAFDEDLELVEPARCGEACTNADGLEGGCTKDRRHEGDCDPGIGHTDPAHGAPSNLAELATTMFNAYNESGPHPWMSWDGKPVPRWEALNDDVRAKWTAAARASVVSSLVISTGWPQQEPLVCYRQDKEILEINALIGPDDKVIGVKLHSSTPTTTNAVDEDRAKMVAGALAAPIEPKPPLSFDGIDFAAVVAEACKLLTEPETVKMEAQKLAAFVLVSKDPNEAHHLRVVINGERVPSVSGFIRLDTPPTEETLLLAVADTIADMLRKSFPDKPAADTTNA